MSLPRESDPCGKIDDALEAKPKSLHARLAIAFARQETTEHGHQAYHLIESIPLHTSQNCPISHAQHARKPLILSMSTQGDWRPNVDCKLLIYKASSTCV